MSKSLIPLAATCVLAAAMATSAAAGGSVKGPPGFTPVPGNQQVTLTLISYLPVISPQAKATLENMVAGFEKAQPNIKVNIQAAAGSGAGITAAVQQDLAAGQTPDVVQSVFDMLDFAARDLGAQDLTKIAGTKQLESLWGGKYPYEPAITKLGIVDGHQAGIPWVFSTPVIFYNADLFRQAGLDPSKPPTTWPELQSDILAVKKAAGVDGLATCAAGAGAGNQDWCTQAVVYSNGGTVMSADSKKLTWTDPKTVAAIQTLAALGKAGALANLTVAQQVQEFAQGKLAAVITTSALQAALVSGVGGRFPIMTAELPGFGGKPSVPTNSGSALTIFSKDSLHQRAAWELIRWLTSPTSYVNITQNIGYLPLRTSLINVDNGLKGWAKTQTLIAPNLNQLKRIVPWQAYPGGNFAQVEILLENAIQSIVYQGADAKSTLAQAQSQAQDLLP